MAQFKVGYFVGSLATASINRKLARALTRFGHVLPLSSVTRASPGRRIIRPDRLRDNLGGDIRPGHRRGAVRG